MSDIGTLPAYPTVPRPAPRPEPSAPPAPVAAAPAPAPMAQPPAAAPPAIPAAAPAGRPPILDINSAAQNFMKAGDEQKVATERTAAAEAKAGEARSAYKEEQGRYITDLHSAKEQELRDLDQGPFKPTHDTLAGMGALFTMVGMMGAFMGGGGTSAAAANAQAALTGIVGGWNKGEEAEVARQKMIFDENANYLQKKAAQIRDIYRDYEEDALKVGVPTAEGRLRQRLMTEADAAVNAERVRQAGAAAGAKQAEDIFKMADAFETKKMTLDAQRQNHLDNLSARAATTAQSATAMDPQALDYYATRSLFTGKEPAFGRDYKARMAFQNFVAQKAKNLGITPQMSAAMQAGIGSEKVALTQMTKVFRAMEAQEGTMLANIKIAEKLSPDAQKSAMPFLNKWLQTGSTALGMKGAPAYASAIITIADQYAKIISGSTGAAGSTDAARQQALDVLNPYLNSGQIGEVYGVLKQEVANKKKYYEEVRQEIMSNIANVGTGGGSNLSGQDQQALEWANSNPTDPRSAQIKARLGAQ